MLYTTESIVIPYFTVNSVTDCNVTVAIRVTLCAGFIQELDPLCEIFGSKVTYHSLKRNIPQTDAKAIHDTPSIMFIFIPSYKCGNEYTHLPFNAKIARDNYEDCKDFVPWRDSRHQEHIH